MQQPYPLTGGHDDELVAHLGDRYCPELSPMWVTPQSVAHAVRLAVSPPAETAVRQGGVHTDVPLTDVLGALALVPHARQHLDSIEIALIEAILDRGVTWEQLGAVYGSRSPQAMQQFYRRRGGMRSWMPGPVPRLGSPTNAEETTANVVSRVVPELIGTWRVTLRRGCRPGLEIMGEVLPVVIRLEQDDQLLAHRPWPEWLAKNRAFPRRVRSAVRSIERVSDVGTTIVIVSSENVDP